MTSRLGDEQPVHLNVAAATRRSSSQRTISEKQWVHVALCIQSVWGGIETRGAHEDVCSAGIDLLGRHDSEVCPAGVSINQLRGERRPSPLLGVPLKGSTEVLLRCGDVFEANHDSSLAVGVPNPSTRDRCAFGGERVGLPTQVLSPFFGRTESPYGFRASKKSAEANNPTAVK